VTESFSWCR